MFAYKSHRFFVSEFTFVFCPLKAIYTCGIKAHCERRQQSTQMTDLFVIRLWCGMGKKKTNKGRTDKKHVLFQLQSVIFFSKREEENFN